MSLLSTSRLLLTAVIAVCMLGSAASLAMGQTANDVEGDQALLEQALGDLDTQRQRATRIDARARSATEELDRVLAEQRSATERLSERARTMYRSGERSLIWVLLGAEDFQDFVTRWDLLMQMSRRDAADLETLRTAEADVRQAAEALMSVQAEQARALEEAERQVASAREELAASEAALREFESHLLEGPEPSPAVTPSDTTPQVEGTGDWLAGVASHYSWTFTGRGASGEPIGPYSMMVAHRSLPFGTLVEFEHDGRRAVASVEDRGPHVEGRMWDLGPGAARALDFTGVHEVRYRVIGQ